MVGAMTYTISRNGEYLYVARKPTEKERIRFISNGYNPPDLVREPNASVYQYLRGELPPNYPVPAVPYTVDWCEADVGYVYIDNPNDETRSYAACFMSTI